MNDWIFWEIDCNTVLGPAEGLIGLLEGHASISQIAEIKKMADNHNCV